MRPPEESTGDFIFVPENARKLAIVAETLRLTDYQLEIIRRALQLGVNSLTDRWHLEPAEIVTSRTKVADAWNFYIRETLPGVVGPNTLGFHRYLPTGEVQGFISAHRTWRTGSPFGFIIRGTKSTAAKAGRPEKLTSGSLTEVISHEIFETLVDPKLDFFKTDPTTGFKWLVEVSDQAHAFLYTETITLGLNKERVILADFALPSFYDRNGSRPFSFTDSISAPFFLEPKCYGFRIEESGRLVALSLAPDRD